MQAEHKETMLISIVSKPIKIVVVVINVVLLLKQVREAFELKNVTKSGKSPQGGGSAKNIKKSKIRNLDFLIRGRPYFHFFPKFKCSL